MRWTITLALVLLTAAAPLRAQEKLTISVPYRGVNVFANLLHEEGLTPIKSVEELKDADPRDTIVIIFGKLNKVPEIEAVLGRTEVLGKEFFGKIIDVGPLPKGKGKFPALEWEPIQGLGNFQWRGGALLIASDYPSRDLPREPGRDYLKHLSFGDQPRLKQPAPEGPALWIPGNPVYQEEELAFRRSYPHCPILEKNPHAKHPLLGSLTKPVVAMRPSFLQADPLRWRWQFPDSFPEALFQFGKGCYFARAKIEVAPRTWYLVASPADADLAPHQRFILAAGHGIFMNFAMVSADHDNFLFARNAIRWLAEGPRGKRTKVFLMEQGTIVQRLDLPLKYPPIPWGALMNTAMDQIQRRGLTEEFVRRNWSTEQISRALLIVGAVLFLPFAFRRFIAARFRRDTRAALVVGLQDAAPPPLPVNRQREAEVVRRDNFTETARILVLQWLDETAGDHHPVPAYRLSASFWRRRRLQRDLEWVLRLARPDAETVSARDLRRLAATLAALAQAQRQGEFAFVSPGEPLKKE